MADYCYADDIILTVGLMSQGKDCGMGGTARYWGKNDIGIFVLQEFSPDDDAFFFFFMT